MEAPGSSEQQGGGRRRRSGYRRSLSCPTSLESLCEQALSLETTPCSVLQLNSLDDDVAVALRRTLHETQQEILRAVEAGVLARGGGGDGGGGTASGGRRTTSDSGGAASDNEERQRSGGAASGSFATDAHHQREECLIDEAELAGLSAKERELAIKRAKNREAARRSRERKVERITSLQAEVDALRSNNFVLLKCIEEVVQKALAARAEQKQLRDKLAQARCQAAAPQAATAVPSSAACTPPAAQRAAAMERDLQRMEEASPTRLLLPHWPGSGDAGAAAATAAAAAPAVTLYHPRPHLPTSAELRRQLQEAVAGGLGSAGGGGSGGSSGHNSAGSSGEKKAADREHHLHPSPQRMHNVLLEPAVAAGLQQQVQPHAALLQLRQEGQGLLRSCSAPGGLLAGTAAMIEGAGAPPTIDWFRGVAA